MKLFYFERYEAGSTCCIHSDTWIIFNVHHCPVKATNLQTEHGEALQFVAMDSKHGCGCPDDWSRHCSSTHLLAHVCKSIARSLNMQLICRGLRGWLLFWWVRSHSNLNLIMIIYLSVQPSESSSSLFASRKSRLLFWRLSDGCLLSGVVFSAAASSSICSTRLIDLFYDTSSVWPTI